MTVLISVVRRWQTTVSTISTFSTVVPPAGMYSCPGGVRGYILEEKGPSTAKSNQDRRIPAGVYSLKWHNSPKFGGRLPLIYGGLVPMSRYILMHSGNSSSDTEGCLLVGSSKGEDSIGQSKDKLAELLKLLNCYNLDNGTFQIEITEEF